MLNKSLPLLAPIRVYTVNLEDYGPGHSLRSEPLGSDAQSNQARANMDVIRRQIRALRSRNAHGQWFVPEGSLVAALPHETVRRAIENHCQVEPYAAQWITQAIVTGARKVFAMLILIREENSIAAFLEHHLQSDGQALDSRLPFSKSDLEALFAPEVASEFEEEQWGFIAPVFSHRLLHRKIQPESRLPFVESQMIGGGGFGHVHQVVIPAGHHHFDGMDSTKDARIVRKELRQGFEEGELWIKAGFNEHQIMSYLHHLQHPNILPLLTSYTYNGVPNFLLPLAEGGDLEKLLNERHRPKDFAEDTRFYDAVSGLTSALETLHEYKSDVLGTRMIGYHHDLKPRNVLVSEARFLLSDFGLSKLKTGEDSRTPFKQGQGHYLAPECEDLDHDFSKGVISRASDVWSLGCILLEVFVFMVGGGEAVAEFRERRATKKGFFTTRAFFCGESLNPEVERIVLHLANSDDAIVRKAAALIRHILIIDYTKRLKASEIALRLRILSFEASHTRILRLFSSIRWRIDQTDTIAEWNRFFHIMHDLTLEDSMQAFDTPGEKILEFFGNYGRVEKIRLSMDRLCSRLLSSDVEEVIFEVKELNDLLLVRPDENQRSLSLEAEAIHLQTDLGQGIPEPVEWVSARNLPLGKTFRITDTTFVRRAITSKDERYLAVEYYSQIAIFALPSGKLVQEIKMPDDLIRDRKPHKGPDFEFSPNGIFLVVCWTRCVCSYRVGPDERESWKIFTRLTSEWYEIWGGDMRVEIPIPVSIAAISPDSRRVALHCCTRKSTPRFGQPAYAHVVYVIEMVERDAAGVVLFQAIVGDYDCVFGFSPDSRQLAVSDQKTVRHEKRTAVHVRLLEVFHSGTKPPQWFTMYCDEKFDKGGEDQANHLPLATTYPRLMFTLWDGRWVAGLWEKSKRSLVLHDLYSRNHLASIDLSCFDALGSGMKNTIFSGNLQFAASRRGSSARGLLGKFQKESEGIRGSLVVCANVKTNRAIHKITDMSIEHYSLSDSGKYLVVRQKKELVVVRLWET
ncbi:MAG: hypothetical protein Q9168_002234 [Polycauliona sp. 1 TL-2023]